MASLCMSYTLKLSWTIGVNETIMGVRCAFLLKHQNITKRPIGTQYVTGTSEAAAHICTLLDITDAPHLLKFANLDARLRVPSE